MPQNAKPKVDKIEIRIEPDLAKRARLKALQHGSLAVIVRALLRAWIEGQITLHPDAIARENERATKRGKKDS